MPLDLKVELSKTRIQDWVNEYGEDGVNVSFSGGKDSTVLLDLVRHNYPNIPAVFFDTGLEYPEIRNFVKSFENIEILKPKMTFKEVIKKYGYPVVSKEQAKKIYEFRNTNSEKLARTNLIDGKYPISKKHIPLIYAPFKVGDKCCYVMKKSPALKYSKQHNRHPFTGQMAAEGMHRQTQWTKYGCNMYDAKDPKSNPLSFWTEQDVLQYIKDNDLPIAPVYGDIVEQAGGKLSTTGVDRTGCMFCAFGAHLTPEPNKFQRMKITHPAQYKYCIGGGEHKDGWWQPSSSGLGMWKVLDYIGVKY